MRTISGILGATSLLLLLAAMGSAGIAMGWFNAENATIPPSSPILPGLAAASGVLSVILNHRSKKSASDPGTRDRV